MKLNELFEITESDMPSGLSPELQAKWKTLDPMRKNRILNNLVKHQIQKSINTFDDAVNSSAVALHNSKKPSTSRPESRVVK